MRLIDADALPIGSWIRDAEYFQDDIVASVGKAFMLNVANAENDCMFEIVKAIKVAPTIDPESLRPRGTWNISDGIIENVVCSRCGTHFQSYYQDYRYCPRCGAKMDGGEQP